MTSMLLVESVMDLFVMTVSNYLSNAKVEPVMIWIMSLPILSDKRVLVTRANFGLAFF